MSDEDPFECEPQNANTNFVRTNWRILGRDNPQDHSIYDITYSMPNYDLMS